MEQNLAITTFQALFIRWWPSHSCKFLTFSDFCFCYSVPVSMTFPDFPKRSLTFPYFCTPKSTMQEHHNTTKQDCCKLIEQRHRESGWQIIMKLIFAVISHGLLLTCLIFFYLLSDSMLSSSLFCLYIYNALPVKIFLSSHARNSACRSSGSFFTFSTIILTTNF